MDPRLYSGEEISLNLKVRKLKLKTLFDPKIYVFHLDRNFKHFFRQRFIYGSTGLWNAIHYPCKESYLLLAEVFLYFIVVFSFNFNLSKITVYLYIWSYGFINFSNIK